MLYITKIRYTEANNQLIKFEWVLKNEKFDERKDDVQLKSGHPVRKILRTVWRYLFGTKSFVWNFQFFPLLTEGLHI